MKKLIFVPMPLAEESPHSLVKRAARCHGFATAGQLNGLCIGPQTFRSMSLTQNSDFAKLFVAEAGIYGPSVQNGFYATIERPKQRRRFVIGGIEIPVTYLRLRTGAYCDGCFDQGWERQVRDLKFAEFCPYHLKKYLTHCPECQMPVEWWHALDGKCRYCYTAMKCQPCTIVECRPERKLVELMRTHSQLDFDRLLTLTRQLGYAPEKPTMPDTERRMIFIGALSIMTDDSSAILEHLFKLHSLHPNVEKFWIAARFSLVTNPDTREASRIFLETRCEPVPSFAHNHDPLLLTLRQLRSVLNASVAQMAKIKKRTPFAQRPIYSGFTVDEAIILASKAKEFLSADDGRLPIAKIEMLNRSSVCQELGISQAALKTYVQHGLLKPYLGQKKTPFFFRSDIEQFSKLYEPLQKLSTKIGMTVRRLHPTLDLMNIEIVPNRGLKDRYWLVKKADIDRIISANKKKTIKKPRQFLALSPVDFRNNPPTDYVTIREAAKMLEMVIENVNSAIETRMLLGVCRGRHMRIYIPKIEIKKFKTRYCTTVQAASLIKVHYPRAPDLLFGLGVRAVIGPTEGARDNVYKATDILRVAKLTKKEDPREHFNYLSKTLTAKRLNISPATLLKLMAAGLIKYTKGKEGTYFRPSWLDRFKERYILPGELLKLASLSPNMVSQMIDALGSMGILPISVNNENQHAYVYERKTLGDAYDKFLKKMACLDKSRKYRTYIKHTTRPLPDGYIPVKNFLKTYDISSTDFSNLFIKFCFINTKTYNQEKYISASDGKKCEAILKNYCTRTTASHITPGGYGKITILLRSGILKNETPIPANHTQTRLISKLKLKKYLDSLASSSPNE
ncbi:hypothetical protein [Pseudomonas yamanorum]|uniref:hypothetical protein n=1 Tax=Pseudomonas yamanorum TaxID=515393 RepID=UPI00087A83E4|nr:hypothetical protein [Pseudomonas yamanorum]SDU00092.1 hypothetical protein SAMN05216237_1256 [Pseudomonas yamanorum]